ncbi:PAS domain-containing sensor histidine kinase [Chitinophaga pinensis]|uniref:histidine kinase n=1 Tax=Chitinophaga pinensis (strain ATCC 43595 / DSM 2588 / LMG 13176 / NBRC 15968 / NCIMB 11800 / UQM 2034) TaxID=485918 RepID=A0A979G158_CHIPD|nr:PAS domain S-box protein [Chitinophaga pinensis]ACU58868.1 PAS/PAC sensor signal transduction histidine kinase [Chitinophaga pinensis DSM 2588]
MEQGFNTAMANTLLGEAGISSAGLLEQLPVAAYICDVNGGIICCNARAVKLWGRTPSAGETIFHDSTVIAAVLEEGLPLEDWQSTISHADDTSVIVRGSITPLKDGDGSVIGLIHCFEKVAVTIVPGTEIRAGHLAELNEQLQQSEERYYKMIEEVEDYAILSMDRSGIIQNWNKGAEKIKGYHESEIVGRHFSVFYLPEDRKRQLPEQLISEAMKTGKAAHEGWRMRKDGTRFWGSIVITALHDADRQVIGFSKVTRDLTERKLAEDRIRQYASDLEFQNRELEQFAYAAAHDMKEPLRKVQFYNNYINDNAADALPEKAREYLHRSINAASRMQGLIDDLLMYSQASAFSKEPEDVDLTTIVNEVLEAHQPTIDKLKAVVHLDPLPVMRVIPFQFSQLFDNLISNALKYHHPERHPHINITITKTQLPAEDILLNNAELNGYKLSVSDNGIGFESDHAEKIFDVFQRLHTLPDIAGTGIGLAICKKIVLNHRGQIKAYGIPGIGATFDIFIPIE